MPHSSRTPENEGAAPRAAGIEGCLPSSTTDADDAVATMLGRIPSGLFVVTWREAHTDRGMLASWIMQAGFQPPTITVAVGTTRDLLRALETEKPFVVNVLGESQRSLLARFGRPPGPGEDPFAGLAVERTSAGVASIGETMGWLECLPTGRIEAGDHTVVVARVAAARVGTGAVGGPLVHLRRNGLRY
ncbi:MAG: flavin reductase family protein [Planctomycetia bacterium]|nr:flavin reductase family protein [Planctomycetia bacterium]